MSVEGSVFVENLFAVQQALSDNIEAAVEKLGDRLVEAIVMGKWDYKELHPTQRVKLAEALLEGTSSKVAPR